MALLEIRLALSYDIVLTGYLTISRLPKLAIHQELVPLEVCTDQIPHDVLFTSCRFIHLSSRLRVMKNSRPRLKPGDPNLYPNLAYCWWRR